MLLIDSSVWIDRSRGLETDVWFTADREVVCVHDPTVRSGLRRYRVASTKAARLVALGVPRLGDLYAELGAAYELSVDLKDERAGDARARDSGRAEILQCRDSGRRRNHWLAGTRPF